MATLIFLNPEHAASGGEQSVPGGVSRKAIAVFGGAMIVGLTILLWLWWNGQPNLR